MADRINETTVEAVRKLRAEKICVVMLTGDNRTTAAAVARKLGIDDVIAEVLPEEKDKQVKLLQEQGHFVAMAGDRSPRSIPKSGSWLDDHTTSSPPTMAIPTWA